MRVDRIITQNPACCTADTTLERVAQLMVGHDCGAIPVVEQEGGGRPVGIVTDRDIVCRTVAKGLDPMELRAGDCMTHRLVTVRRDATQQDAVTLMEQHAIRRLVVVDDNGHCCGILAQADVAEKTEEATTAHLVREVSRRHNLPATRSL